MATELVADLFTIDGCNVSVREKLRKLLLIFKTKRTMELNTFEICNMGKALF